MVNEEKRYYQSTTGFAEFPAGVFHPYSGTTPGNVSVGEVQYGYRYGVKLPAEVAEAAIAHWKTLRECMEKNKPIEATEAAATVTVSPKYMIVELVREMRGKLDAIAKLAGGGT